MRKAEPALASPVPGVYVGVRTVFPGVNVPSPRVVHEPVPLALVIVPAKAAEELLQMD